MAGPSSQRRPMLPACQTPGSGASDAASDASHGSWRHGSRLERRRNCGAAELIRANKRRLVRELLWFAGTMAGFFALFSRSVLDLGGGPGDPFDWIAALCLYVVLVLVRMTVWAVKKALTSN